jgi:O-antigen/teichoic acid export membrane protein
MIIASLIGGGCNYLYQLFMGRMLGPEDFGIFGSLFAISYMIYIFSQTIQTSGAKFISTYNCEGNFNKISFFIKGLLIRMLVLGSFLYLLFLLLSGYIAAFLKIDTITPIIILGSIFIFSSLLPVNLGLLQGLEKFGLLGLNTIINFASKLFIGVFLVSIGLGVNGALLAVVLGFVIALIFSLKIVNKYLIKQNGKNESVHFKDLYLYSIPTMIAMLCLSIPANIDVIIVKHFFKADAAGIYAAATVLGKIIIFATNGVTLVTFPIMSRLFEEKKDTRKLLHQSLLYAGIISGIAAFGYWFLPHLIVELLFGIEFIKTVPILQWYGVAMLFFSLVIVLIRYNLAVKDSKYVVLLLTFTIAEVILWWFYNDSITNIVMILVYVNIILFVISYIFTILRNKQLMINESPISMN